MDYEDKYLIYGVSLFNIRNKNETRIIDLMPEVIDEYFRDTPDPIDIQDIYALALNKVPARYVQQGGLVLREPISEDELRDAIRHAVEIVRSKPNY